MLQEKLHLANVRNNLICQPPAYTAFGLQKIGVLSKPFLHTRPFNFWYCSRIFDVYVRKVVQGASRKTTLTMFFFLAKIVA